MAMNKRFLFLLLSGLILCGPALADAPPNVDAKYLTLVDAAFTNPDKADWCGIRDLYPDTSFYRDLGNPGASTKVPEVGSRMVMERSKDSVNAFLKFSREHFASINAHRYAAYLYKWHMELAKEGMDQVLPDLGNGIDYIDFSLEKRALRELLKCIVSKGDGRSEDTAYTSMTMEEEQILVEQYFHVDATASDTKQDKGHVYNIISVQIPDGPKEDVWFQLDDRMVKAIMAAMAEKQKTQP